MTASMMASPSNPAIPSLLRAGRGEVQIGPPFIVLVRRRNSGSDPLPKRTIASRNPSNIFELRFSPRRAWVRTLWLSGVLCDHARARVSSAFGNTGSLKTERQKTSNVSTSKKTHRGIPMLCASEPRTRDPSPNFPREQKHKAFFQKVQHGISYSEIW